MARRIDPDTKAAILADLVAGAAILATSKKFGVARNTVIKLQSDAGLNSVRTVSVREKIWEAVDLYLIEAIESMRVHLKVGRDEAYLKSHDTSGLAALHNSFADKVARLSTVEETATMGVSEEPIDIRSRTG